MEHSLRHRITIDSEVLQGSPLIRGMRIRVSDILGYLAAGDTRETLLAAFPELEDEDISAALSFAAENLRPPKACLVKVKSLRSVTPAKAGARLVVK